MPDNGRVNMINIFFCPGAIFTVTATGTQLPTVGMFQKETKEL